jgi:hypothetical protein
MGALSLGSERILLGGLGRRLKVYARPGRLTAGIAASRARLQLSATTDDNAAAYTDPRGGTHTARHAALASVELTLHRPGDRELTLSSGRGAHEYVGQRDDRPVVASALVAAFFRCVSCIVVDFDATRMGATSWHPVQRRPITTGLTCGFGPLPCLPPHSAWTCSPSYTVLTPDPECCI